MVKISLNLEDLLSEQKQLSDFLASPNAFSDSQFSNKNKRFNELETLISMAKKRQKLQNNIVEAKKLASGNDELAELAKLELEETETSLKK